jgi:hypothetical protein
MGWLPFRGHQTPRTSTKVKGRLPFRRHRTQRQREVGRLLSRGDSCLSKESNEKDQVNLKALLDLFKLKSSQKKEHQVILGRFDAPLNTTLGSAWDLVTLIQGSFGLKSSWPRLSSLSLSSQPLRQRSLLTAIASWLVTSGDFKCA